MYDHFDLERLRLGRRGGTVRVREMCSRRDNPCISARQHRRLCVQIMYVSRVTPLEVDATRETGEPPHVLAFEVGPIRPPDDLHREDVRATPEEG